ncbi:MAG: D-alanyl-D-alanine carboxypeptidase [Candidatus Taylorbacteria bacterium]|nr:D-alanyl-D-alanine carboxypeptidase [Candidatus Taylorbacteria bacterium]
MRQGLFKTFFTTFSSVAGALLVGVFIVAVVIGTFRFVVREFVSSERTTTYTNNEVSEVPSGEMEIGPKIPEVTAGAYIVTNLTTGKVLVQKNADKVLPIASISKLYTAVVTRESLDSRKVVTIDADILATEGATAGFKKDEKISVANLLYPLLMVSSNDAAEALAASAGRTAFVAAMNNLAASIGATGTRFADPSGLSQFNVSTARELSRFLGWLYIQHPEIIDITKLKTKSIRGHTWTNTTHYLNLASYAGGKNGFTDEAERTAASIFLLPNEEGTLEPHIFIVLLSKNRDKDVLGLLKYVSGGKQS